MKKIKLNIQRFASKSTTFSESDINVATNTSSLTINIYFSADNNQTWFNGKTLYCSCAGQTQSATVSLARGGSVSASFKFSNLAHNADGTQSVGWSWSCATGTSALGTIGDSGTQALTTIPRYSVITGGTDFNDEQNPTLYFTNPSGGYFPLRAKLEAGGNAQFIIRDIPSNLTSYTIELTEDERNRLRALIPTSNSLPVLLTICCMSGNTELSASAIPKTMTIVNANPAFTNFEFEDTNAKTVALTGNNQINVNGYSNIKVKIATTNKAVARKQSSMSKYRYTIDNQSFEIEYSDSTEVSKTINNATSGNYNIYAIDSRNNSTLVTKLAQQTIPYEPIYFDVQNCNVARTNNGIGTEARLTFSGKVWNRSFGSVTNSIKTAKYYFKKTTESQWHAGTTNVMPNFENDAFSFSGLVKSNNEDYSFDVESSYNFIVELSDELVTIQIQLTPLSSGTPNIAFANGGISFMGMYDVNEGGLVQIAGKPIDKFTIADFFGDLMGDDGGHGVAGYGKVVATKVSLDVWKFEIENVLTYSSAAEYYMWGYSISKLSNLLNSVVGKQVKADESLKLKGSWEAFKTDGTKRVDRINFGTCFDHNSDYFLPARYYNTSGTVGGWGLQAFDSETYFKATIYLKEV